MLNVCVGKRLGIEEMSYLGKIEATRRISRTRVLMTGVLVGRDGAQKVTIRDVSRSGAQIVSGDRLEKDSDVLLSRGPLFAAARVIWAKGEEAGLKFYRELSENEVEGTLPDVVLAEAPPVTRLARAIKAA